MTRRVGTGIAAHRKAAHPGAVILAGLVLASAAQAQPHSEDRGGGGHGGFAAPRQQEPHGGFGGGYHEGGFHESGGQGGAFHQGFAGHDTARFAGAGRGFVPARFGRTGFGRADWVHDGWHGRGPFLAYAGGRDAWDWRGAWGNGWRGGFWGPGLGVGWGGWAWGGIALGVGIGFIVAPPVYILPPPIYALPPPVVLGLPAIEPPPIVGATPPPPPAVAAAPSTAAMVAAAVPPPIVVSPPPYVMADAPPPPVIFAPPAFAFAIAPPVLALSVIGPAYFSGGYFTGGYIARGYYGAVWDKPYWHSSVHSQRPGFFARVGTGIGLGGVFGRGGGAYVRRDPFYGRPGGFDRGGATLHGGGFHGGEHGRERG